MATSKILKKKTTKVLFLRSLLRKKKKEEIDKMSVCSSMDITGMTDNELISIVVKKRPQLYAEILLRYQKKLFIYIYHLVGNKEETEDILQNVFLKAYKNIKHFDVDRKFSSWIYRIAHNETVNFLKRKGKRYTVSWEDISTKKDRLDIAIDDEKLEDKMEHQEIASKMKLAIAKLPLKYQQVLKMRYFQEYSYQKIGKLLNKPQNTVGTLINRAKKKLFEVIDTK
ncbi:MAG: RNA polymerase sigma factor [bacterium]